MELKNQLIQQGKYGDCVGEIMGVAILKKCGEMLYFAGIVAHLLDFLLNLVPVPRVSGKQRVKEHGAPYLHSLCDALCQLGVYAKGALQINMALLYNYNDSII